ncbi:MAG: PrsW family intramembrane metalloprotease [Bacteroidaceae bacterium]|nr:PrsW family intramembrane metalloprotease [Bacteroidaceae bacterium]
MISFLAALLPVAIYIFVVYKLDSFSLISVRGLLTLVFLGMLAALACYGIFLLTGKYLSEDTSDYVNPIVEEMVKAISLFWMARRKKMVFFIDSVICGAAVGGGFSILENVFYLMLGESLGFGTVLFRGLEVALIHMGCSAILAVVLMMAVRLENLHSLGQKVKAGHVLMTCLLFITSPALHVFHNSFHVNPIIQFVVVFGVMALLIVWIYQYDSDMIHQWLDTGLDQQVDLLINIREGQLGDTAAGKFLVSVKENFPPVVFFDVICYVQLYVELSVAAKSRFLMREAGIDTPLEDSAKELYLSQYAEFKSIEKRMGSSARITVSPVVRMSPADRKSLDDLLSECRSVSSV